MVDAFPELLASHSIANGLLKSSGFGRLSAAIVRQIRRSEVKRAALAVEFGISEAMVCSIRSRKSYKWVR